MWSSRTYFSPQLRRKEIEPRTTALKAFALCQTQTQTLAEPFSKVTCLF